jgi:uncharacterized protein
MKMRSASSEVAARLSRRRILSRAASAAALLPVINSPAVRMNAQTAAPRLPRNVQGGAGPIQVMLITKGHPFDREPFYLMFDSFGKEITWTHVEYPAAEVFFDPVRAERYDVLVFYDMYGKGPKPGATSPSETINLEPSPAVKKGMKALLRRGKGMLFFHHAVGSWVLWPEYHEILGAAAEFGGLPLKVRGKEFPYSGYRGGVEQHISVVDKTHPIVQGLGDGFDIVDEVFMHPVFEDSVHALLRTDFKRIDSNFPMQYGRGWRHPEGSSMAAWVKTAERSPVVYLQFGHDAKAWENPAFRTLMSNAIRWTASRDALTWAAANRTAIFK